MSAKKILLVDDESDILDFLSFNLELAVEKWLSLVNSNTGTSKN